MPPEPILLEADAPTGNALATVWSSLNALWRDFLAHLPLLSAGAIVLLATWGVSALGDRLLKRVLERTRLGASLRGLCRHLAYISTWVAGLIVSAVIVFPGMTPAKILAVLGLGSVAIGFAFKDIAENFVAGILILWRFPFDPGDYIECNGIKGKVEEVTIRMTMIRKLDGELAVLPNAMLFKSPVYVLSSRSGRRVTVTCGVAYGEDLDESRDVIHRAVERCETVSQHQPIEVFAQEFASSSINFEITWWTGATPLEIRRSRDEVVAAVKRALDEAGIEIPFPYRMLTFKHPLETVAASRPKTSGDGQPETGQRAAQ